jgi:hypothetical protein
MWNVSIVAKKVTIPLTAHSQEQKLVSILNEGNVDQKGQASQKNTEGDDDSLDMNVFERIMEGKHTMIVTKSNDDSISINDTDTFDYSMQDKITHEISEHNNYNDDSDELAYPFSKRIKLKHEPEKAQENVPVQYTADIIVETKNRDGTVVPMRALLDTGTTSTIILR